jgi:hypothetical protein
MSWPWNVLLLASLFVPRHQPSKKHVVANVSSSSLVVRCSRTAAVLPEFACPPATPFDALFLSAGGIKAPSRPPKETAN